MPRSAAIATASGRKRTASPVAKPAPRNQRRKDARPGEIVEAATVLFAEKGFAATRLEDVARRADVSKGTIYVYFETKEALFRAVAREALGKRLTRTDDQGPQFDGPLTEALPRLVSRFVGIPAETRAQAIVRMVIAEAHNFPDLARIWHDEVAMPLIDQIAGVIERSKDLDDDPSRDPRLLAFSVIGPLVMALLHRATFSAIDGYVPDVEALAAQHAQILLGGLLGKHKRKDN